MLKLHGGMWGIWSGRFIVVFNQETIWFENSCFWLSWLKRNISARSRPFQRCWATAWSARKTRHLPWVPQLPHPYLMGNHHPFILRQLNQGWFKHVDPHWIWGISLLHTLDRLGRLRSYSLLSALWINKKHAWRSYSTIFPVSHRLGPAF